VGWRRRDEADSGDRGGPWQSAGAVRGGGGATITSSVAEAMWSRLGVFLEGGGGVGLVTGGDAVVQEATGGWWMEPEG
jgi:hypothetical protein